MSPERGGATEFEESIAISWQAALPTAPAHRGSRQLLCCSRGVYLTLCGPQRLMGSHGDMDRTPWNRGAAQLAGDSHNRELPGRLRLERIWQPAPPVRDLPREHALQQLPVPLRVARPVLLQAFVHAVLQCARAILGVHTGHLQYIQFSLTVTACRGSRGGGGGVSAWGAQDGGSSGPMSHHLGCPSSELLKAQS